MCLGNFIRYTDYFTSGEIKAKRNLRFVLPFSVIFFAKFNTNELHAFQPTVK